MKVDAKSNAYSDYEEELRAGMRKEAKEQLNTAIDHAIVAVSKIVTAARFLFWSTRVTVQTVAQYTPGDVGGPDTDPKAVN